MPRFQACLSVHTIRKRYVWTQIFLSTEEKVSVCENTRLRVDGQIRFESATCGRILFLNTEKKSPFSKIPGYVLTGPIRYTQQNNFGTYKLRTRYCQRQRFKNILLYIRHVGLLLSKFVTCKAHINYV